MDIQSPSKVVQTSDTINIHQFNEICRSCLKFGAHQPMYERVYNEKSLSDILRICTTLQVQDEKFPQNICASCASEILKIHVFYQKYQETEASLRHIINVNKDGSKENTESENLSDHSDYHCAVNSFSDSDILEKSVSLKRKARKKSNKKKAGPPFVCKICAEIFEEYSQFKKHQVSSGHFTEKTFACSVCTKRFTSSKLRTHMRSHTKEKPFKCVTCNQEFSMAGNLKRHVMTHTGERPHVCDVCGKGFIQATTLYSHIATHFKEGKEKEVRMKANESPLITCKHCGRLFKRLSRYNSHIRKHEANLGNITNIVDADDQTSHEFVCSICGHASKTKPLLKSHERTHGEKSFLCSECGKSFVTKAALQSHFRVHSGEKPHSCTFCNKSFSHVGSFQSHMLTHTGQKPYQCDVCSKSFTQLTHLKYHKRTHSGERPYICSFCGKSFALNGNLTVHIRTHTGETPYICSICGKGFYDSSSLKKHKRGHTENMSTEVNSETTLSHSSQLATTLTTKTALEVGHLGRTGYHYHN